MQSITRYCLGKSGSHRRAGPAMDLINQRSHWFRKDFTLSEEQAETTTLRLDAVDADSVFVNIHLLELPPTNTLSHLSDSFRLLKAVKQRNGTPHQW